MQADYSVELGKDDPALEIPWEWESGGCQYQDLKRHPELLREVSEAEAYPELGNFLQRINGADLPVQTAKCDAWGSDELSVEEEIFGARCKFVSYVDLIFCDGQWRASLEKHTTFAKEICRLLERAPEMASAAEFVVRHCYFHHSPAGDESLTGFCMSAYVTGYGDSQAEAEQRWAIALKLLQNVLVQYSLRMSGS